MKGAEDMPADFVLTLKTWFSGPGFFTAEHYKVSPEQIFYGVLLKNGRNRAKAGIVNLTGEMKDVQNASHNKRRHRGREPGEIRAVRGSVRLA